MRRFLGAYAFYNIWIPNYVPIVDSRKGYLNSKWGWACKDNGDFKRNGGYNTSFKKSCIPWSFMPIYMTIDMSRTRIGWVQCSTCPTFSSLNFLHSKVRIWNKIIITWVCRPNVPTNTCKPRFKPWIYKVGSFVFTNRVSVELLIDKISRQK